MEVDVNITVRCCLVEFRPSVRARADSSNTDAHSSAEAPPTAGETGDTSASHKDEQKRGLCNDLFDLLIKCFSIAFYLCEPTKMHI